MLPHLSILTYRHILKPRCLINWDIFRCVRTIGHGEVAITVYLEVALNIEARAEILVLILIASQICGEHLQAVLTLSFILLQFVELSLLNSLQFLEPFRFLVRTCPHTFNHLVRHDCLVEVFVQATTFLQHLLQQLGPGSQIFLQRRALRFDGLLLAHLLNGLVYAAALDLSVGLGRLQRLVYLLRRGHLEHAILLM